MLLNCYLIFICFKTKILENSVFVLSNHCLHVCLHEHTFKTVVCCGCSYENKTIHYTIRKTCPCKVYPLKPHIYIVKLGYAGEYLFFLFLLQNIHCGCSLEPPRRGGSNVYPQSTVYLSKNKKKYQNLSNENSTF